jgi:PAS domain S-box-containing protein
VNFIAWLRHLGSPAGLDEPTSLDMWRARIIDISIVVVVFALPVAMAVTFPVVFAEKRYWIIGLDLALWAYLLFVFFFRLGSFRHRASVMISVLYLLTFVFLAAYGPTHARSAWLVLFCVMSALLYGVRGAIAACVLSAVSLMALYTLMDSRTAVWAAEHGAPFGTWVMFVVNVTAICLMGSLPVGYILRGLDRSLQRERGMHEKLSDDKKKLDAAHEMVLEEIRHRGEMEKTMRFTQFTVDHMADAAFWMGSDGRFLYVNEAACRKLGYSREELLKMSMHDVDPNFPADAWPAFLKEFKAKGTITLESRHRAADGAVIPVEVVGNYLEYDGQEYIFSFVRDITGRKEDEEKLAYSERYLRSIIRNEPECVKLLDAEGTVLDMNPAGLAMLDADNPEEIIGKSLSRWVAPEHREALAALSERVLKGEKLSGEFKVIGLKGNTRWLESHMVPFEDKSNDRTLILAVTRDITERKRAEEDFRRAKEDLERQNVELKKFDRMKDSLIRDVSHELKTPVAKHIMQMEILKPLVRSPGATAGQQEAFRVMQDSIRRQQSVLRNLLDLSRLESGERTYEKREMHLESFLAGIRSEYQYALDAFGAGFDIDVPLVSLRCDEEMLWHVFSNLINNALKFRKKDTPLKIRIAAEQRDGELLVRVADNGIGMDPAEKEKAFTRFFQTSASTEGSGVGLAICRRILEDLGGSIRLDSEGKDTGVTVTVALPIE